MFNDVPKLGVRKTIELGGRNYRVYEFCDIVKARLAEEFSEKDLVEWSKDFRKMNPETIYKTAYCFLDEVSLASFNYNYNEFLEVAKKTEFSLIAKQLADIINSGKEEDVDEWWNSLTSKKKRNLAIVALIMLGLSILGFISMLELLVSWVYPLIDGLLSQILTSKDLL